jgi:hypothetical protein
MAGQHVECRYQDQQTPQQHQHVRKREEGVTREDSSFSPSSPSYILESDTPQAQVRQREPFLSQQFKVTQGVTLNADALPLCCVRASLRLRQQMQEKKADTLVL